jgi:hypothetical protein
LKTITTLSPTSAVTASPSQGSPAKWPVMRGRCPASGPRNAVAAGGAARERDHAGGSPPRRGTPVRAPQVGEHVEARTRGRQEDRVARPRDRRGARDRLVEGPGPLDGDTRRRELLRDRLAGRTEEERDPDLPRRGRGERRVPAALVDPAREEDHRPGERLDASCRGADVRRLRVVEPCDPAALGDARQPVRQGLDLVDRRLHRRGLRAREPRDRDRGEDVLDVVAAREPRPAEGVALLGRVGQPERGEPLAGEGSAGHRARAERHDARAHAGGRAPCLRVVAVHDRVVVRLLRREDPRLRLAVLGERPVAVQVIGRDVQETRDARPEALDPLELEARHLRDRDLRGDVHGGDQRHAEVPARERAPSRALEREADEARRRALPVRPGDGHDRAGEQLEGELDLAADGDAATHGSGEERRVARHAGARHDEIDAGEEPRAVVAERRSTPAGAADVPSAAGSAVGDLYADAARDARSRRPPPVRR